MELLKNLVTVLLRKKNHGMCVRAHQASHHQAVEEEEEDPEDDQGGDKAKDEVQEEGGKQEGVVKRGRRIRMENRKYKGAEWAV